MQKFFLGYIVKFILLVLLQIFVFNKIQISSYINPFVYLFIILILPFNTPKYLLLIIAFFTGLTIDMFVDTPGMHASATVFMAFLRPAVINTITVRKEFESSVYPSLKYMDVSWIVIYSVVLIFIHHTFLFYLEVFSFKDFFNTLGRTVISVMITSIFIIIAFLIEKKPQRKR